MAIDTTVSAPDVSGEPVAARAAGHRFIFLRNAKAVSGLVILGFFTLIAIIGPWIAPYDPSELGPDLMSPPSPADGR